MSHEAQTWAAKAQLRPSSLKFMLMACANYAGAAAEVYVSLGRFMEYTCQDRKTVIANIARLQELGYLTDTGRRTGRTGQIKIYQLRDPAVAKHPENGTLQPSQNRNASTVPKSAPSVDANSSVSPVKESRFSHETVPKTEPGTLREQEGNLTPLISPPAGGSARKPRKTRAAPSEPPEFAEIRAIFPKRAGSQRWGDAIRGYVQRRAEGHTHAVMRDGVMRYAELMRRLGKLGTPEVLQAGTFFGDNLCFLESYELAEQARPGGAQPAAQASEAQRTALRAWIDQQTERDADVLAVRAPPALRWPGYHHFVKEVANERARPRA